MFEWVKSLFKKQDDSIRVADKAMTFSDYLDKKVFNIPKESSSHQDPADIKALSLKTTRRMKRGVFIKKWTQILAKYAAIIGVITAILSGVKIVYEYWDTITDTIEQKEVKAKTKSSKQVLTNLFYSWETKNLRQYIDCWDPSAVQISDNYSRNYNQIVKKRTEDFERFKRVVVKSLIFESIEVEEDLIQVYCVYSMHFETKDGTVFNETDIRERYFLIYSKEGGAKIVRNDAYVNAPVGAKSVMERKQMKEEMAAPAPSEEIGPVYIDPRWAALPAPK